MKIRIKLLSPQASIPEYKTAGASGFDLAAAAKIHLYPGETAKVPLGIAVEIPDGYEMQIRPRSGISSRGRIMSALGTIDQDFRAEIHAIVTNISDHDQYIHKGDRIAQGVICPVVRAEFEQVNELSETERGAGGFGSTGIGREPHEN